MSKPFFRVEMMPARDGDALLVEYGTATARRLMIDGGPFEAFPAVEARLNQLPKQNRKVELLVVTHVDTDHIEGVIRLLAVPPAKWPVRIEQVWFNGWRHLTEGMMRGGREGEFMSALIEKRLSGRWNTAFGGRAVRCGALADDAVALAGGMKFTLLSPDQDALLALQKDWQKKVTTGGWNMTPGDLEVAWLKLVDEARYFPRAGVARGPENITDRLRKLLSAADDSKANASSIAFIAEYGGKRCVFLGDAHMKIVCASLKRLGYSRSNPLKVNAVKVAHHGSKNNVTAEFLGLVDAKHWLYSTDGSVHGHPDDEGVDAVIEGSMSEPTLWFNYRSKRTEKWEVQAGKAGARFDVKHPAPGKAGIVVML